MSKLCVFCGGTPHEESKEHVVPQWLIELTGSPKRRGVFGPFYDEVERKLEMRSLPFRKFAFPACAQCNQRLAGLEHDAKEVIVSILAEKELSSKDLSLLLTWLDKVRVGLWLGSFYIQKNICDIVPTFFINSRISRSDRAVLIYKSDYLKPRLQFECINVPAFQYMPCCFTLVVNNYYFLNLATDFLLSRQLGLPYPSRMSYTNEPELEILVVEGKGRIMDPILRMRHDHRCTQVFQPMFTRTDIRRQSLPYYDTDYVQSLSADHEEGIGKVFYYDNTILFEFPSEKSVCWIPPTTWHDESLRRIIRKQTLEFQIRLLEYGPMDSKIVCKAGIDRQKKRLVESQVSTGVRVNRDILERLRTSNG